MSDPWTDPDARPVVNAMDLIAAHADDVLDSGDLLVEALNTLDSIEHDLADLRAAFKDIRVLVLDGLGENYQRDHLREIAKVLSRPTIARFTRGT